MKEQSNPDSVSPIGTFNGSQVNNYNDSVSSPGVKPHRTTLAHTGELMMNIKESALNKKDPSYFQAPRGNTLSKETPPGKTKMTK